jgi:hypothetical protein
VLSHGDARAEAHGSSNGFFSVSPSFFAREELSGGTFGVTVAFFGVALVAGWLDGPAPAGLAAEDVTTARGSGGDVTTGFATTGGTIDGTGGSGCGSPWFMARASAQATPAATAVAIKSGVRRRRGASSGRGLSLPTVFFAPGGSPAFGGPLGLVSPNIDALVNGAALLAGTPDDVAARADRLTGARSKVKSASRKACIDAKRSSGETAIARAIRTSNPGGAFGRRRLAGT